MLRGLFHPVLPSFTGLRLFISTIGRVRTGKAEIVCNRISICFSFRFLSFLNESAGSNKVSKGFTRGYLVFTGF